MNGYAMLPDALLLEPWIAQVQRDLNGELENAPPQEILRWGIATYRSGFSIGTAFGASGMALIDMALDIDADVDIFYIDTGFFFTETLALIERVEQYYGRAFRSVTPDLSVDEQAAQHGPQLYRRNPDLCCHMRKVLPLKQALAGRTAWTTALRRDQSPSRANTPVVQWNERHSLVKIAPLATWTEADVWCYIHKHDVPYNELHDQNYPSIGCWPCTRAVQPGEDLRAGRWPGRQKTECGLHWAR